MSLGTAPQIASNLDMEDVDRELLQQRAPRKETHILDLTSHIVGNILSRLPIKSIFCCRCVCSTWRSVIADPLFTKRRLDRADEDIFLRTDSSRRISAFVHFVDIESIRTTVPPLDLCDKLETRIDMRFALPNCNQKDKSIAMEKRKLDVVNSCSGFLCLRKNSFKSPSIVCNPITGEFVMIPKPKKYQTIKSMIVSGFGCCSKSDEYKVVRLVFQDSATDRIAEVYTLGTNSWRNVGCAPDDPTQGSSATYLNGAIHWLCDGKSPDIIMAFDIEDEQFRVVPPPPNIGDKQKACVRSNYLTMGLLGGSLFVCDNTSFGCFHIWVMEDYGVQDSWMNKFSIDFYLCGHCRPIKQLHNGELVMIYDASSLVLYNYLGSSIRIFKIREAQSALFETIALTPNFASLKRAMVGDCLEVQNVKPRGSESEILEEIEAVSLMEEVPVLHGNKGHLDQ